jgi:hypothetical protein
MPNENQTQTMSDEDAATEVDVLTPPQPLVPDVVVTAADLPDELEAMAYTHAQRVRVVKEITKQGIPAQDKEQMTSLLKALDGMDRQSLTRMRMSADKEIAKGTNDTNTALLAAVLKQIPNMPRPENGGAIPVIRDVPQLPADFEVGNLVDGQTEKSPPQDTYQSFMARTVT